VPDSDEVRNKLLNSAIFIFCNLKNSAFGWWATEIIKNQS